MLDKFSTWQYTDGHNCWDFVREFLIERAGVPAGDVPKYGICPNNKRAMTKAAREVEANFVPCEPRQYSIACHYYGKILYHVGIVYNNRVLHVGSKTGRMSETIPAFERRGQYTVYRIHKSLWHD